MNHSSRKSQKSQIWSLDLIVGIAIFLTGLILFYGYAVNRMDFEEDAVSSLLLDGKLISGCLISEGYPPEWTLDNVTLIGLTNGNMDINPDKVENFKQMPYSESRKLLSTSNDYYLFFEDKSNNTIHISGVDWVGKDYNAESPERVIKVVRFVSYNSSIIRMVLYVW